jgi:phenol 2-monooxygenase
MARKPEEISDPQDLATYYLATAEFPSGFMTQYGRSSVIGADSHQSLAPGFPIGKRFKSVEVVRVCDGNVVHLGHHAKADGRWRVYAFADKEAGAFADAHPGEHSAVEAWAAWMDSPESPIARYTPAGADPDAVFDVKVIYQQPFEEIDISRVPALFTPRSGPLGLTDWEKIYTAGPSAWTSADIFAERELSRDGVVVVVRPDQYVAAVLPLSHTAELEAFFGQALRAQHALGPVDLAAPMIRSRRAAQQPVCP